MLSKIELENFKCFQGRTAFPLGQLTLLTGVNGCGKSTFLQSLLLMRQSIEHSHTTNQIVLNGKCINLNSFNEVRNTNTSRNENVKFKYYYNNLPIEKSTYTLSGFVEYTLFENVEDDMVAQIKSIEFDDNVCLLNTSEECTEYKIRELYNYTNTDLYNIKFDYNRVFSISRSNTLEESKGSSIIMDLIPVNHFHQVDKNSHQEIDFSFLNSFLNFSRIHYISADRLGPQDSYFK
jgi:predicted ATPase